MVNSVRLIVLWTKADDVQGFEGHYRGQHLQLARDIPGLQDLRVSTLRSKEHHLMAELVFDDLGSLKAGLASPEGAAVAADAARLESEFRVSQLSMIASSA